MTSHVGIALSSTLVVFRNRLPLLHLSARKANLRRLPCSKRIVFRKPLKSTNLFSSRFTCLRFALIRMRNKYDMGTVEGEIESDKDSLDQLLLSMSKSFWTPLEDAATSSWHKGTGALAVSVEELVIEINAALPSMSTEPIDHDSAPVDCGSQSVDCNSSF